LSAEARKPADPSTGTGLRLYRYTVRQYLKMIAAGVFPEGTRTELLAGVVAPRSPSQRSTEGTATWTPVGARSGLVPYRFTVRQYMKMINAGVFPNHARAELLAGLVVRKMTKNTPHSFACMALASELQGLVGPGWLVLQESPLDLGTRWRPEPDVAVVRGPATRYRAADPVVADLGLIVEVADSSYRNDRRPKWRGYAAAGVPAYWIVDLNRRRVEVHQEPQGRGMTAGYQRETVYGPGASLPMTLEGREAGLIAVDDLLP